jgi:hypothetical protein
MATRQPKKRLFLTVSGAEEDDKISTDAVWLVHSSDPVARLQQCIVPE